VTVECEFQQCLPIHRWKRKISPSVNKSTQKYWYWRMWYVAICKFVL